MKTKKLNDLIKAYFKYEELTKVHESNSIQFQTSIKNKQILFKSKNEILDSIIDELDNVIDLYECNLLNKKEIKEFKECFKSWYDEEWQDQEETEAE